MDFRLLFWIPRGKDRFIIQSEVNVTINKALKETGLSKKCVAVSKCGRENEQIIENIDALEKRTPDYWTLILASK